MDTDKEFDLLLQLPKEIGIKVLSYLSAKDLSLVCRVSKNWRDIANCNLLWRRLCLRESVSDVDELMQIANESSELNLDQACRWAQIYNNNQRLHMNWAGDYFTLMSLTQEKSSVDLFNNLLAVAYMVNETPSVDIFVVKSSCLHRVQTLPIPYELVHHPVAVSINGQVLAVEMKNISALYRNESGKFIYEGMLCADEQCVCSPGEEHQFVRNHHRPVRCWTLCLAGRYIWYQTSYRVVIYDRNMKTFKNLDDVQQVVAVDIHGEKIVVQCPHSVQVFYVDGQLLYTYLEKTDCFYTGLAMSTTSFAFLQSEDFGEPHVVQLVISTPCEVIESPSCGNENLGEICPSLAEETHRCGGFTSYIYGRFQLSNESSNLKNNPSECENCYAHNYFESLPFNYSCNVTGFRETNVTAEKNQNENSKLDLKTEENTSNGKSLETINNTNEIDTQKFLDNIDYISLKNNEKFSMLYFKEIVRELIMYPDEIKIIIPGKAVYPLFKFPTNTTEDMSGVVCVLGTGLIVSHDSLLAILQFIIWIGKMRTNVNNPSK